MIAPLTPAMTLAEAVALAAQFYEKGRLRKAEGLYRQIRQALPDEAEVPFILGTIAHRLGRHQEAAELLRDAIALDGAQAVFHATLGVVLKALGRLEERLDAYGTAVRLDPADGRVWSNLGGALNEAARFAEAEAACRQALARRPGDSEALNNLGNAVRALGRPGEALDCFARVLAADPQQPVAHLNRGLLRLALGDLAGGWADYEDRFAAGAAGPEPALPMPRWQGEDLGGRSILVWREQGLGDELMFASCYPDLIARARGVVIECDPRLAGLFARSFPAASIRPETCRPETCEPETFDVHTPAGSLPRYLRPTLAAFPETPGYLIPDPARVAAWRARLGDGFRVGIAWRSRVMSADRRGAYTRLDEWGPVFAVPGACFVNLQYDRCEDELAAAEQHFGVAIARWPGLDLMGDLEEAAALTAALDLVITAPTAVGELAGALGVPVWRIAPADDWSALGSGRRPWFPSMRLFPAAAGERLADALAQAGQTLGNSVRAAGKNSAPP